MTDSPFNDLTDEELRRLDQIPGEMAQAVQLGAEGDLDGATDLIVSVFEWGPAYACVALGELAELYFTADAARTGRSRHLFASARVLGADGQEVDIDAAPPEIRYAARIMTATANRDAATVTALFRAMVASDTDHDTTAAVFRRVFDMAVSAARAAHSPEGS